MAKFSNGVCVIVMGETLYRFTSHVLCFQFHEDFVTHFSPHQFGDTFKGGYEIIIHGTFTPIGLFFNWMLQMPLLQCKKKVIF
jgi:hypothetical protein